MDSRDVEIFITETGSVKRLISHGVAIVVVGRRVMMLRNVQRKIQTLVSR